MTYSTAPENAVTLGGELTSVSVGGAATTFSYFYGGLRKSKTSGGVTKNYYYDGSRLIAEKWSTGAYLLYHYDESGSIYAVTHSSNGSGYSKYYLLKDLQGDVVQIRASKNEVLANYEYDAWGNVVSVTDASGNAITSTSNFALINPIRYRGYYYDSETGFYYLKSRYYDPANCRFVSADGQVDLDHGTTNLNLFAYCGNDPVNRIDPTGEFFLSIIVVCVVVGAVVGGTIGGIAGNAYANSQGYTGWAKAKCILTGIGIGAFAGGAAGYLAAPLVASATGVAGISVTSAGISTIATVGTSFGKLGTLIANNGQQIIDWGKTTWHGMQRMFERGVTQEMAEIWVKTGKALQQSGDKILYITRQGAVVVNKTGKLITAYTSKNFDDNMREVVKKLFGK